jgi:hypothetical protein
LNQIDNWCKDILDHSHVLQLKSELEICTKAIEMQGKYGNDVSLKIKKLDTTINQLFEKKKELDLLITVFTATLNKIELYTKINEGVNVTRYAIDKTYKQLIESVLYESALGKQSEIYDKLGQHTHLLTQQNNLKAHIVELEREVTDELLSLKALQLLEENISQSKGLIAEQMMGFMSSCIDEINIIISKVWGYSLVVQNCNMDDGNLDYIFPVIVENEESPDLSTLSTSQSDIINLAFIMIVRQYLQLQGYPIYMDETGASFDELHRKQLMAYVMDLVSNKLGSQLFMVNHYANIYGGLANHSVIVLDDRNITVPSKYNENVVIKYE